MLTEKYQAEFIIPSGLYLQSHSVGLSLANNQKVLADAFFQPWFNPVDGSQPWACWLMGVERFSSALARLFNRPAHEFCPQANVSSALTKLLQALPQLKSKRPVVLLAEQDFPSIGFVLKKALGERCQLRFIPADEDLTDADVWNQFLSLDTDLAIVTHGYSNSGMLVPLRNVVGLARSRGILTVLDVAQTAGIRKIDLDDLQPDFVIGSCIKWLCGGPGAGFLWLHSDHLYACEPADVGWFSHQTPFEFDIHHFNYADSALRFLGGTPNVAPLVLAANSINHLVDIGVERVEQHNQVALDQLSDALGGEVVSPRSRDKRTGTLVLDYGHRQANVVQMLQQGKVHFDQRAQGMRLSPHLYNTSAELEQLLVLIEQAVG